MARLRVGKDRFLENHPNSPLAKKQNFKGLDYYPLSEKYRFQIPLIPYDEVDIVEMATSDGQIRHYDRIGYLEFEIEGNYTQINVYQSRQNSNHYFIPFRDSTSGNETYGAGRYLDVEKKGGVFELDFNKAYNPYCAYNDSYSCPLPPMENWLDITIRAGEKDFKE